MNARKPIDIEKLLVWAYREELPKDVPFNPLLLGPLAARSGWGSVAAYGRLYAKVDTPTNQWGVIADLAARREPHPDAFNVAEAVEALAELELVLPDDWAPFADLGDLGDFGPVAVQDAIDRISVVCATGTRRLKETPQRLIFKHAILGGCPEWECEIPVRKPVTCARGKPKWFLQQEIVTECVDGRLASEVVEVDGYDDRRGKPYPGAYHKSYLEPDPTDAAVARAEYEVWHAALRVLAADLEGELVTFDVLPPGRSPRPWEFSEAKIRVLRDETPTISVSAASGRRK